MARLYSLTECTTRLSPTGNRPLIRGLIAIHGIPTYRVGKAVMIDAAGFRRLRAAHRAWVERPRVSRSDQSITN